MGGGNSKLDGKVFKFRQFVDRLQLIDISFKGPPTTWNNRREGIYNIRERLDRCLATHQWLLHYPTATVQHLEDLGSDHRPLWVTFKPPYAKAKQYFKFDQRWAENESISKIIKDAWISNSSRRNLFTVASSLKNVRHTIVDWHKNHGCNSKKKIKQIQEHLTKLKSNMISWDPNAI